MIFFFSSDFSLQSWFHWFVLDLFACWVFFKLAFMAAGFEKVHSPAVSDLIYDDFLEELK